MPNLDVQFNGQTLIIPGAYYTDNVSAALQTTGALVPPLVWLVNSYGGKPLTPVTYYTAQDVTNALRGAPASDMVPWIFSPSTQLNGASLVTVIPTNSNTQATFNYTNGSGTTVLTATTANYGLPSNLMQTSTSAGSIAGTLITLYDGYTGNSIYADNLGVPLQIAYTGTVTGVTLTVTQVASGATSLTTAGAGVHNLNLTLGPAGYANIAAVAEAINGTGYFAAQVLNAGPGYTHGVLPSQALDAQATVALAPASGMTYTYVNLTAALTDPLHWFQYIATNYIGSASISGTSNAANQIAAGVPLTHFSGGTNAPPTLSTYASALNVALSIPGWVVIADQNITGLPALLAQHAITASNPPYRSWRRAVSGSNIGDSISSAITTAEGMNAFQATYVYPGVYRNNPTTGVNTLYGGVYVAAAAAAMMAGNPVMIPLTQKTLVGNGVEVSLTVSQIDQLQQGGVMPLSTFGNTTIPQIVSDFTTWQNDSNPENVFNQQVAGRQYLGYVATAAMQPYTGTIQSTIAIGNQKRAMINALNAQVVTASSQGGVLNSWNNSTLILTYNGQQQCTSVSFQCTFVGQNRFTLVTAYVQPLSLSA